MPQPAAACRFARSMMPLCTKISGCALWIALSPVEPSRSESMHITLAFRSASGIADRIFTTVSPKTPRLAPTLEPTVPRYSFWGSFSAFFAGPLSHSTALVCPFFSRYAIPFATAMASCPWHSPSTPSMPGHILRLEMTALGPSAVIIFRIAAYSASKSSPLQFVHSMPWPSSVFWTSYPGRYSWGCPAMVTLLSSTNSLTLTFFATARRAASESFPSICAPSDPRQIAILPGFAIATPLTMGHI
mmetsp:Transcript_24870/g.49694  ORF Transcript_24870/g.49694 Transcript_24870/m.49694 type:complete len:245 (+) Transcript_24870:1006-1740(+)